MSNRLIDIVDITKSYGDSVILDQLNLYIRENEFLTLLGPSGLKHLIPERSFLMEKILMTFRQTAGS